MAMIRRGAAIFPVSDLAAASTHYRRLGFATREYQGGGYAYATRDRVEIHLIVRPGHSPTASTSAVYLWVEDADALAAEWVAAGLAVTMPQDTEWAQHEGSHVDPDGNLIRFGSPVHEGSAGA